MHHERYNMFVAKYALIVMYTALAALSVAVWQITSTVSWEWVIGLAALIGTCVGAIFGAGVVWGGIKRDVANFGKMAQEAKDELGHFPLLRLEVDQLHEWKKRIENTYPERRRGKLGELS